MASSSSKSGGPAFVGVATHSPPTQREEEFREYILQQEVATALAQLLIGLREGRDAETGEFPELSDERYSKV